MRMSKRPLLLITLGLIASILFTAVAHACADVKSIQAAMQTPCDHSAPRNAPLNKPGTDNCDTIRYAMLAIQAAPCQTQLVKLHAILLHQALPVNVLPLDYHPWFVRSHAPPFSRPDTSPYLSHVVLRI